MNFLSKINDWLSRLFYHVVIVCFTPINFFLSKMLKNRKWQKSVLHVSYRVHVPYYLTRILRTNGMKADYLAMGKNGLWQDFDYTFDWSIKWSKAFKEFWFFWTVMARYEVFHSHFMLMLSNWGWELPLLKRMGRKLVVHYRGCDARYYEAEITKNPKLNVCQECDYNRSICQNKFTIARRHNAQKFGDLFLATTPDLIDHDARAIHFPFFTPPIPDDLKSFRKTLPAYNGTRPLKIVTASNHPGYDGTRFITEAVANLVKRGYAVEFDHIIGVSHRETLERIAKADLAVGKLKMGYYANFHIEAMLLGVPGATYIRPEFITEEIKNSALILVTIENLETTLEDLIRHPEKIADKQRLIESTIKEFHNNNELAKRLIAYYALPTS